MSKLRLVHAADLHLDSAFVALPEEAAEKRRQGQRELFSRLVRKAETLGADALLLVGDVFESDNVSPETARDFCRALSGFGKPVFICTGNHDYYIAGSVWDRMSLPENVTLFNNEGFRCVELPELNSRFWGAGFSKAFCPPLLKDFTPPEKKDGVYDIMLLHGDLSAGGADYCPITPVELSKTGMDYVALGHIHERSPLQFAGKTAYAYPGCPEGRGYDELGEKGFLVVDLTLDKVRCEFVPLGGVRYEIRTLDVSNIAPDEAVEQAIIDLSDKDYCRIILLGEVEEEIDLNTLRKTFEEKLAQLQLYDETQLRQNVWEAAGGDNLLGVFLQKLRLGFDSASSQYEKEKIELAAAYGIAALGGGRGL